MTVRSCENPRSPCHVNNLNKVYFCDAHERVWCLDCLIDNTKIENHFVGFSKIVFATAVVGVESSARPAWTSYV